MVPLYVPTPRVAGTAVTITVAGVAGPTLPLTGEICNQLPPVLVAALAANWRGLLPTSLIVSCAVALLVPCVRENESVWLPTAMIPVIGDERLKLTATVRTGGLALGAVMVTDPL
jgi:hypothetical protein